jgi:[calcium/calmodulin-dependent protein kinase] kinase
VKEFSKSRLRKRAQSNLLRKSKAANAGRSKGIGAHIGQQVKQKVRAGFNLPMHAPTPAPSETNSLDLIREEIAIMKKLDHPNVVGLIEVLDHPSEDSLYMVLEMCKKGVVMKVGLGERAEPYTTEQCRHWFRDMILGLEYCIHSPGSCQSSY